MIASIEGVLFLSTGRDDCGGGWEDETAVLSHGYPCGSFHSSFLYRLGYAVAGHGNRL